ncbi:hypothetical protein CCACVL1_28550 [Corchorus capsularis]|uniref:Uncharacterized protein n=1 Tax=Corchorus capsularis TaxID=210143 RepID=A0A1R3G659_COCAP|nr:hypothetical protein CCACVL1_28550 [Corchorus capsularis]
MAGCKLCSPELIVCGASNV